ncbi:MAG: exonuclease SbcCD subunit D, partial [Vulcanococcus sp.]
MRFLHASDWHLGRQFHGASLLEEQAVALDRIVALAERRERAQLLSGLADRCTGRAAPSISLQRWVLSAHLADI